MAKAKFNGWSIKSAEGWLYWDVQRTRKQAIEKHLDDIHGLTPTYRGGLSTTAKLQWNKRKKMKEKAVKVEVREIQ